MVLDDHAAPQIAKKLDDLVEKKSQASIAEMLLLGLLAGVYIGFGAMAATTVSAFGDMPIGLTKFLAASVFCVGLILVIIPGSELFTGNVLMVTGLVDRKLTMGKVLRCWFFVYFGNFLGSVLLAWGIFGSGLLGSSEALNAVGKTAIAIAEKKMELGVVEAFLRGVFCNMLVCLAVILAISARFVHGKVMGIYFPVMVFVLCGFEHSIANMYFLPVGLLAKGAFLSEFPRMFSNLIPVTLGNIVGGLLVVLLHPQRWRQLMRTVKPAGNK